MRWFLFGVSFIALNVALVLSGEKDGSRQLFHIQPPADCNRKGYSLNIGESFQRPGHCSQAMCMAKNNVVRSHCPRLPKLYTNCKIILGDLSKPFPACCSGFICKG